MTLRGAAEYLNHPSTRLKLGAAAREVGHAVPDRAGAKLIKNIQRPQRITPLPPRDKRGVASVIAIVQVLAEQLFYEPADFFDKETGELLLSGYRGVVAVP